LYGFGEAAEKIRIGYPDLAAQFIPLPLAEKRGFFKEESIQAEFVRIVPTVALAAMASGEIDYYTSIGSGVAGMLRGIPIRVVSCFVPSAPIALIARPEFKSVAELRGKTIGINTYGSPIEVIGKLIVKHFGLDPEKDVKFLATGVIESRFAAMKQGLTVATLGSAPIDFQGKKMGFVVLANAHELFTYPASGLSATASKIKQRPDEVKRVIRAGIKANRYIAQNRDGTIQGIVEWLKVDREMATATYDSVAKAFNDDGGVPEDGLRLVIEEAKKATKISREVALSDALDLSILRVAQRELGVGLK
jgi:NitT/TauT family transport system substrate-binding protein